MDFKIFMLENYFKNHEKKKAVKMKFVIHSMPLSMRSALLMDIYIPFIIQINYINIKCNFGKNCKVKLLINNKIEFFHLR